MDLLTFIREIEDKSPALDHLGSELFTAASEHGYYFKGRGLEGNTDFLGIVDVLNGLLVSLVTDGFWDQTVIGTARHKNNTHELFDVRNIGSPEHGLIHSQNLRAVADEAANHPSNSIPHLVVRRTTKRPC